MGYTITIGESCMVVTEEGDLKTVIADVYDENAPAFGDISDHRNFRMPAYSVWHEFTREVGLETLFFDKSKGLMRNHPGIEHLTLFEAALIREAKTNFEDRHAPPKMLLSPKTGTELAVLEPLLAPEPALEAEFGSTDRNATYARLVWLDYWVSWAVECCEEPAIRNN